MKTFISKPKEKLTVGEIVDAMATTTEFVKYKRDDIFSVVEIFIKEYVGLPGSFVTKKFTPEAATELSLRVCIPREDIVKIVAVFRLRAGKSSGVKTKLMKAYDRVKGRGRGRTQSVVTSRM